uniref:Flagellar biosynthesis protein FliR n=1 Tax=uncultured Planctomycetota bacterium TaxID=120965 RepID=H5SCQ8_9BACT|nr:flagellar biosynthesis protein FliR [uncultured Planctomycetota bacterium]
MEPAVVSFSLMLSRVAVIVGLVPFLGGSQVPRWLRLGMAVALTTAWYPPPVNEAACQLCQRASENAWLWALLVGREVLIGLGLALALRLVLAPARIAGEFLAQEMLMSFAASTAPGSETPSTLLGQFLELTGVVLFFGLDGHHILLAVMHAAWVNWPVAAWNIWPATDWLTGMHLVMHSGVRLALPVVACLFLLGLALALWARAAPSLNLFSLGFVVRVLSGLVAVYVFAPVLLAGLLQVLQQMSFWLGHYGR